MLARRRLRATSAGNVGTPLVEALRRPARLRGAGRGAVQLPAALAVHRRGELRPPAGGRRPQPRPGPPRLARRRWTAYALAKGRIYQNTEVACVYNVADPATEDLVREADVVEGAAGHRLHPRRPGAVDARAGRGRPLRPRVRRAAPGQRRGALLAGRPAAEGSSDPSPRTRWRTSSPPPRWPGRRASRRSPCATGCGRSALRRTGSRPSRRRARRRVGPLGRRLQGHQPARRERLAGGVRERRLDRRRATPRAAPSTTWCRPTGRRLRGAVLLGRGPGAGGRRAAATRPRGPRRRGGRSRRLASVSDLMDAVVAPRRRTRAARGHRAARPGLRVLGPVPLLRPPRRRVRRGRDPPVPAGGLTWRSRVRNAPARRRRRPRQRAPNWRRPRLAGRDGGVGPRPGPVAGVRRWRPTTCCSGPRRCSSSSAWSWCCRVPAWSR